MGIHLITIPYWWNGEISSLATTIQSVRPDMDIPAVWISQSIPSSIPSTKVTSCMHKVFVFIFIVSYQPKEPLDLPEGVKHAMIGWYTM